MKTVRNIIALLIIVFTVLVAGTVNEAVDETQADYAARGETITDNEANAVEAILLIIVLGVGFGTAWVIAPKKGKKKKKKKRSYEKMVNDMLSHYKNPETTSLIQRWGFTDEARDMMEDNPRYSLIKVCVSLENQWRSVMGMQGEYTIAYDPRIQQQYAQLVFNSVLSRTDYPFNTTNSVADEAPATARRGWHS